MDLKERIAELDKEILLTKGYRYFKHERSVFRIMKENAEMILRIEELSKRMELAVDTRTQESRRRLEKEMEEFQPALERKIDFHIRKPLTDESPDGNVQTTRPT